MKVLIVGNCATRAYVEFFQNCFPGWETRSAVSAQVNKWVEEKNEAFLSYAESADIFVGLTDRKAIKSVMPKNALNVFIPSFDFFGYFPDSVFLQGITSPLELGIIHSRIAVSAYISGVKEQDALKLFSRDHFSDLGYFDELENSKQKLFSRFNAHNIDLKESFENWSKDGNFLYTINHPHTVVFFDIVCLAMKNHYPELLSNVSVECARKSVDNYLAKGLVWPVYPAIANFHSIAPATASWRTSDAQEPGIHLDLQQFIARSYERYDSLPEIPEACIEHLGGMEEILKCAGIDLYMADYKL